MLSAGPVTLTDIPPDLARDWVLPDGTRAHPGAWRKPATQSSAGLRAFVDQVTRVAPEAGGSAVTIEATSATIIGAFRDGRDLAVVAIAVILLVVLRRPRDVAAGAGAADCCRRC